MVDRTVLPWFTMVEPLPKIPWMNHVLGMVTIPKTWFIHGILGRVIAFQPMSLFKDITPPCYDTSDSERMLNIISSYIASLHS